MPPVQKLRSLEKLCAALAWTSFGLGATAILGMCAVSLLTTPPVTPEQFLLRLAVILAASLIPTAVFRGLVALLRRRRARHPSGDPGVLRSLSPLEDSTLGP